MEMEMEEESDWILQSKTWLRSERAAANEIGMTMGIARYSLLLFRMEFALVLKIHIPTSEEWRIY